MKIETNLCKTDRCTRIVTPWAPVGLFCTSIQKRTFVSRFISLRFYRHWHSFNVVSISQLRPDGVLLLSWDFWSKLLAGTYILDSRHPGRVCQPIRGQYYEPVANQRPGYPDGASQSQNIGDWREKTENKNAPGFWRIWGLLNIQRRTKRNNTEDETGWILVGSVVNIFIKMKNVGFIALNCLRKKLDRNSSISKLSLPGVKCETLSPAPWN